MVAVLFVEDFFARVIAKQLDMFHLRFSAW